MPFASRYRIVPLFAAACSLTIAGAAHAAIPLDGSLPAVAEPGPAAGDAGETTTTTSGAAGDPLVNPAAQGAIGPSYDPATDPANDPAYASESPNDTVDDPAYDPTTEPAYGNNPDDTVYDPTADPAYDPAYGENPDDTIYDPADPGSIPGTGDAFDPTNTTWNDPFTATTSSFSAEPQVNQGLLTRNDQSDDTTELPTDPWPLADLLAGRLVLVVDSMVELGSYERAGDAPTAKALTDIATIIPAGGLNNTGYRSEIARLAADFPEFMSTMRGAGIEPSPDLEVLESFFASDGVDRIVDGDPTAVDPAPFLGALADLVLRAGEEPPSERAPSELIDVVSFARLYSGAPVPVVPSTTVTTRRSTTSTTASTSETPEALAATADTSEPESSNRLMPMIGGGLGALALLSGGVIVARRRRDNDDEERFTDLTEPEPPKPPATSSRAAEVPVPSMPEPHGGRRHDLADVLEASRRMADTFDRDEILSIAAYEAHRITNAERSHFIERSNAGAGMRSIASYGRTHLNLSTTEERLVARALETGQTVEETNHDSSTAAVAVVADGMVIGALLVSRSGQGPFDEDETEIMGTLAPLVGSALRAAARHDSARAEADRDPLTGLGNRRSLDRTLAAIGDELVAFAMIDVDHFKNFNDVNGHAAGDDALVAVANVMTANARPSDSAFRYGGEEFCLLFPETTAADAQAIAERVRAAIADAEIDGRENQPDGRVTVSVGVADTRHESVDTLIERADAALYDSKASGRNQVSVAAEAH